MKLGTAIAEIMKREGIEILCGYPVNHLIEHAANADIRPIMVRQERIGVHMADAISRVTSGQTVGAFCMQHGPGAENAMGGVAQCYGESVPVLVLPMGYARRLANIDPNFNSSQAMKAFSKSSEPIILASEVCNIFRRAFTKLKNGRGGPVIVEIPADMWNEEVPEPLNYTPVLRTRYGADPVHVKEAAAMLVAAKRPVIYAGQGVHYAKAWPQLKRLAERLAIPVTSSLGGKSSFPETHALSLGSGGLAVPRAVPKFLGEADVIFGIGCSFTETSFGIAMPKGKTIIHSTLDPNHLNKDVEAKIGLVGDAGLVLDALLEEIGKTVTKDRDAAAVAAEIAASHKEWLAKWMPKLTHNDAPLNPYRVLWDLQHTVDIRNTIITHDAGSPRDQLSPFWKAVEPLSYIGWGKTTQLGYGLGLAMGAKLAKPDKLCINVWGDAAIGFTGMDFETAVRERIPIMSILLNNFSMAIELKVMPISTEKYRSTDISGDYAAMARAFGGYGERITKPDDIIPAIKRGIQKTQEGIPVLLEFITSKETEVSPAGHLITGLPMPHVTIIETGLVSPKNRERHGSYPQMFEEMIRAADGSVTFGTVSIPGGEKLPDAGGLEAILITGSSAGVYDTFDWIAPLEDFVRAAHDANVPMVGICFGHQLIAQALGGAVRKSDKGWGLGRHVYDVAPGNGIVDGMRIALAASHQDQVITPPAGAKTILSSDFTEHAALLYPGDTTLSVQPHPEFSVGYALACCEMAHSKGHAPDSLVTAAKASLAKPLESAILGGAITRFLTRSR